ncbi:MAG: MBL fold metallo-hydrolase [Elusimicrobiota bacterium]
MFILRRAITGCFGAILGCGLVVQLAQAHLSIRALNVAYGESALLCLEKNGRCEWSGLIDVGRAEDSGLIRQALNARGIRLVDAVFITHAHPDHVGSLLDGWKGPRLQTLYRSSEGSFPPELESLRRKGTAIQTIDRDLKISVNGGALTVEGMALSSPGGSLHANGLVVLVFYGRSALLFLGDLDPTVQESVLLSVEQRLRQTGATLQVVTWPHHGDILAPGLARRFQTIPWIALSVGPNPYQLPRVESYPELHQRILRTDQRDSFSILCDGQWCHPVEEP